MQGNRFVLDKREIPARNSGIELLKLIAIILIVISHVVQTLREENIYSPFNDYVLDLSIASNKISNFVLSFFSCFGVWGNTIFIVCSSWFLLRSSAYNKRKWFNILFEVWFVSIVILVVTLFIRQGNISSTFIICSLFPTTFTNNWYITCYLLFYPIHPLLNIIIYKLDKKQLFRVCVAAFLLYCCLNSLIPGVFFSSRFIIWITIYFLMAYHQLYMKEFANNMVYNIVLLIVGLVSYLGIAFVTNFLGLHIHYLNNQVLHWAINGNPFLIVVSIAMFNLARRVSYNIKIINYFSSLSLLIYIIHENIILRTYYRTEMWHYIYRVYGYDNILLWVFIMAIVVLIFSIITSIIYDKTIRPIIKTMSENIYYFVRKRYLKVEQSLLASHH